MIYWLTDSVEVNDVKLFVLLGPVQRNLSLCGVYTARNHNLYVCLSHCFTHHKIFCCRYQKNWFILLAGGWQEMSYLHEPLEGGGYH